MKIEFDTDTAAFGDPDGTGPSAYEVSLVLQSIATKVVGGSEGGTIFDANGNRVGEWSL